METARHRSLVERARRKALLETLQQQQTKKCLKTPGIHECKEKIRAHRASSKATRLFLTKYQKQHQSINTELPMKVPIADIDLKNRYQAPPPKIITVSSFSPVVIAKTPWPEK